VAQKTVTLHKMPFSTALYKSDYCNNREIFLPKFQDLSEYFRCLKNYRIIKNLDGIGMAMAISAENLQHLWTTWDQGYYR